LTLTPYQQYEICANPAVVDLLLSLTYSAAAEGVLDEPLPNGMGLRVPPPTKGILTEQGLSTSPTVVSSTDGINHGHGVADGPDGLCQFDELDITSKRSAIKHLINMLPPVSPKPDRRPLTAGASNCRLKP
jgi:ubiquitin-conjugating enzyme E2 Q